MLVVSGLRFEVSGCGVVNCLLRIDFCSSFTTGLLLAACGLKLSSIFFSSLIVIALEYLAPFSHRHSLHLYMHPGFASIFPIAMLAQHPCRGEKQRHHFHSAHHDDSPPFPFSFYLNDCWCRD